MNYLAIDTSSNICSVTIAVNKEIRTLEENNVKEHSKFLPIFCKELLKDRIEQIEFIALSIGPGSYAGLKTSSSYAKGLAYSLKKPIIPVQTFDGMNHSIKSDQKYFIALYSHRDFAFFQLYNSKGSIGEKYCDKISNMKQYNIYGYGFNNENLKGMKYIEVIPCSKNIGMIADKKINNLSIPDINDINPILLSMENK